MIFRLLYNLVIRWLFLNTDIPIIIILKVFEIFLISCNELLILI